MLTVLTQRFWIHCVSIGVRPIISTLMAVLIGIIVVALLAWMYMLGIPIGIAGWIMLFVYGSMTIGVIAGIVLLMLEWCQTGRQKRASSLDEFEPVGNYKTHELDV